MSDLPPLNALRAFEVVARHLSFTAAAGELGVTQGAVSQQMRKLEDFLGLTLFRRIHQGLRLTQAGTAYLPTVRQALAAIADATRDLRSPGQDNVLMVSVSPGFAIKWLVPRSHLFYAANGEIDLRISAAPEHINFALSDIDVAVRHGDGDWPDLSTHRLMAEQVFPVCAPQLLDAIGPLEGPADLARHTLLHSWEPDYWPRWIAAAGVGDKVDAEKGPVFSDHSIAAVQAAIDGHGVAMGRTALVADDLIAGRLIRPFELSIGGDFAYWVVSSAATVETPKIRIFREWILDEAAKLATNFTRVDFGRGGRE